jgi:hypothetical protein
VPLFYFHIVAGDATFLDESGIQLADDGAALSHAHELATVVAHSRLTRDGTIVIENEDDGGLREVPLTAWAT